MKAKDKVIDYLIENSGCDLCGKCAYYTPPKPNEDFTPCKAFEKDGNTACRKGMIEYFTGKKEYKTFGQTLKQKRKEKGLTQKQLAKKMLICQQMISRWETDAGIPYGVNLVDLADVLDCSIDELVGR